MPARIVLALTVLFCAARPQQSALAAGEVLIRIASPMPAPRWAELERKLLDDHLAACREFFQKYFDDRGYLLCVPRWGQ